jgi:hypothetical protein
MSGVNIPGFKLRYSIVRELGFASSQPFGVYFGQPRDDFRHLLLPTNQLLKRTGVLSAWNPARP